MNVKKILFLASAIFILVFGALQLFLWQWKPTAPDELWRRAARLPALHLTEVNGKAFTLSPGKFVVLIYFNSTCDHCQRQVSALEKAWTRFDEVSLVLMSAQAEEEISAFASSLRFPASADLKVVRCSPAEIADSFGVLSLPQIFVYDKMGSLAGLFSGETPPDSIDAVIGK